MQQENVAPTAVTYGCLLVACEQLGDVERAFRLYKQACDRGIVPTDECHNILINVCAATGRFAASLYPATLVVLVSSQYSEHLVRSARVKI